MSVIDDAVTEAREALAPFRKYRTSRPFPVAGRNILTPEIVGCFEIRHWMIEVSLGLFLDDLLYGITVHPDRLDRSRSAHSLDEVVAIIQEYVDR